MFQRHDSAVSAGTLVTKALMTATRREMEVRRYRFAASDADLRVNVDAQQADRTELQPKAMPVPHPEHEGYRSGITWSDYATCLAASCRKTYCSNPPCLKYSTSFGVSSSTFAWNTTELPSLRNAVTVADPDAPSSSPVMSKVSEPSSPSACAFSP